MKKESILTMNAAFSDHEPVRETADAGGRLHTRVRKCARGTNSLISNYVYI